MLTTIHIAVCDRVPIITAGEDVISRNSDYVAEFDFDEEWQSTVKTVYFVCEDGSYQAVVMSGNLCDVPMMAGEHRRIFVGVQAGSAEKPNVLKTTRPCCLKVKDSIADYLGQPIPGPTPDVYEQIIAMLNNLTTPTWETVQNKPFESIGDGLSVENGVLSAQEGGSADNVRIIDATDDTWENGEYTLNMTTEEYQNILEWYRNQQSGVAKNILLNIDNRLIFQLVYIDGAGMTFIYSNSGYNRYVKVSRRSNEVIATTSDIAGLTKSLMEASYLCNTGHKDDIIALFNMTTVGVIRGAGDSVPDNGKSIRYPALVFFGNEISHGNTYATLIDRNGVMWSIYIRLGSGVIELVEKTDYVTNTALTNILQGYARQENLVEFSEGVANSLNQKLDKNQGTTNAGKILGVGEDGIVVPQDKPTYTLPQATADALGGIKADAATDEDTQPVRMGADGKMRTKPYSLTDADKTAVADAVVAGGIAATLTEIPSGGGGAYKLLYSTTLEQAAVVSVDMTDEAAACGEYIISLAIPKGDTAASYTRYTKIAGSNACATNITTVSNVYGTLQLIKVKKTDDQKNLIEICFANTTPTTPTLDTAERSNWSVKRITVAPVTYADVLFDTGIVLPAGTIIRIGGK